MIFLNNRTRKQEAAVAKTMAAMLFANLSGQEVPKETLAHFFAMACEQNKFTPNDQSTLRIIQDVTGRMNDLNQAAANLSNQIDDATKLMQRAAQR
jgi:hypothetical protein